MKRTASFRSTRSSSSRRSATSTVFARWSESGRARARGGQHAAVSHGGLGVGLVAAPAASVFRNSRPAGAARISNSRRQARGRCSPDDHRASRSRVHPHALFAVHRDRSECHRAARRPVGARIRAGMHTGARGGRHASRVRMGLDDLERDSGRRRGRRVAGRQRDVERLHALLHAPPRGGLAGLQVALAAQHEGVASQVLQLAEARRAQPVARSRDRA